MNIKKFIIIFLCLTSTSLISSAFLTHPNQEGKIYSVYRGRVYFFIDGKNNKSCIDCHTISGIKKNDYPIIVGKKIELEKTIDHINNVFGSLDKEEKNSLLVYIKKLSTKTVEKESHSKLPSKKNELMDKKTRERLLSLGYVDSSENSYNDPLITVKKIVEFSSIELLKFSSLGFAKVRDSLSDIGFNLKSQEQFAKAIVLPVIDFHSNSFYLTIVYNNPLTDSKAEIKVYDYFTGEKINNKIIDLQKTEKKLKESITFQEKCQRIVISIRFFTDDNLKVFGLSLRKLE